MPVPEMRAVELSWPRAQPDASGQAALLLAETMLHILVEAGVLTREQALEVVQTAAEVKGEGAVTGEAPAVLRETLGMLRRMEVSFESLAKPH